MTAHETTPRALKVGRTASRSRLVTSRDIELFTEISGDRNPLHYDEALAARSRFGGIVVQGGVTTAIPNAVSPRAAGARERLPRAEPAVPRPGAAR
jgi:acyl dehydratase